MKFLLFRILLLHRTRDQGFTLPMVIGIGLIMVLLSSVALVQSSEENLTAISKDDTSNSLAMAELGVARYRELLNNNRVLAIYSLSDWTDVADQTCDVISAGSGGWANPNDWRPVIVDETALTPPIDLNDNDEIETDAQLGSYRIVDYRFQNDANPDDDGDVDINGNYTDIGEDGNFDQTSDAANPNSPRGILAVQGRKQDESGVAQIQVTIPIGVNTSVSTTDPGDLVALDPGIWIHQESVTKLGTIKLQDDEIPPNRTGNLVLDKKSNGNDGNERCADIDTSTITGVTIIAPTDIAIRDPRNLPPLIDLPDPPSPLVKKNVLVGSGGVNDDISEDFRYGAIVPNQLILGTVNTPNPDPILPPLPEIKNSDNAGAGYTGDDRYYYEVGTSSSPENLTINSGQKLITDGTSKVIVYVNGNLNINGDVDITNSSDAATSRFLEIHVTGNVTIDGPGTVNIKGLIHAPNGTVTLSNNPTVNLTGSIWANNWDSNGTVNVTTSEYEYYSITPERTPKPLTYPPTGWQQREVKDY